MLKKSKVQIAQINKNSYVGNKCLPTLSVLQQMPLPLPPNQMCSLLFTAVGYFELEYNF